MTSSTRNTLRLGRLPPGVASLRLPPSLPPRDLAYMPYMPSPLSPESPAEASSGSLFTPPTTPQDMPPRPPALAPSSVFGHGSHAMHMGSGDPTALASENKRAQNRRSAKRFREAQKIRWKALQDENSALHGEVRRLADLLAKAGISQDDAGIGPAGSASGHPSRNDARAAAISISALVAPSPASTDARQGSGSSSGSGAGPPEQTNGSSAFFQQPCSHSYPPSPADPSSTFESEAALYAQILGSASPVHRDNPYAAELGVLLRCICVRSGAVVRGEPLSRDARHAGPLALTAGLAQSHASSLTRALCSQAPVALAYVRSGVMVNAVVGPGEDGGPGVVAEFTPFNPQNPNQ